MILEISSVDRLHILQALQDRLERWEKGDFLIPNDNPNYKDDYNRESQKIKDLIKRVNTLK